MRQPVDQVSQLKTRSALWAAIREFHSKEQDWTTRELQQETRCSIGQAQEYVKGLAAAKIIKVNGERTVGTGRFSSAKTYILVNDMGVEAPRVRRDGTMVTQGRGREQMWETMRVLTNFTVHDLVVFASTDDHPVATAEAEYYCRMLSYAGYLDCRGDNFTLVLRHGPKPPMIQRVHQIYDPNINKVVWTQGGEDDDEA